VARNNECGVQRYRSTPKIQQNPGDTILRTDGNVAEEANHQRRYPQGNSLRHFADTFHPTFRHSIATMPSISGSIQIGPWTERRRFIPHADHDCFSLCAWTTLRRPKCEGDLLPGSFKFVLVLQSKYVEKYLLFICGTNSPFVMLTS
jgi:hypothetical protein